MDIFGLDIETVAVLITAGLTVLSTVLGTKMTKYQRLLKQVMDAAEDGQITKDELQKIVKLFKNL